MSSVLPSRVSGQIMQVFLMWAAAICAISACHCGEAFAATISATCPSEVTISQTSNAPFVITYVGDATGTIKVKASTFELSMPAKMEKRTMDIGGKQQETLAIRAYGDTTSAMPDLAVLEACIARSADPALNGDSDSYLAARDACLPEAPLGTAAVPVTAFVQFGIFPGDLPEESSVIVELKRTYAQKTTSPNGSTAIENFPAQCVLDGK